MAELAALDAALAERAAFGTLEPARVRAKLPTALCDRILEPGDPHAFERAFIEGLVEAVEAMLTAFPDNLLWDLEALAARQREQALADADPVARVRALWRGVAQLQHVFGVHGPIRFRYIHDFVYGFDWAKWVADDPGTRAGVGPYDAAFVERMHRRGEELLSLIDEGDEKYGPLLDQAARNPFGFSREPDDELALHRRLSAQGALPVRAWTRDAVPDWRRPYAALREAAAQALQISA
ncbi:MAG: ferrochelatase [Nannocystaceae bacterium]|nr:ferrochelatase [bacterium]